MLRLNLIGLDLQFLARILSFEDLQSGSEQIFLFQSFASVSLLLALTIILTFRTTVGQGLRLGFNLILQLKDLGQELGFPLMRDLVETGNL